MAGGQWITASLCGLWQKVLGEWWIFSVDYSMVSVTFRWKIHFLGSVREISDSQKWEQPHFLMAAYSHPTYPQQITLMTRRLERRMLLLQSDPLKKKIHSTSHRFLFVLSGLGECSLYNLATSVSPSSVFPILFNNLPTTVRPIKIRSHHPIFSTNYQIAGLFGRLKWLSFSKG